MTEYPDIEQLVPHARPMLLLERMLEWGPDLAVCEVIVAADGLFDERGYVPAWLGLEYMAQTVAAFSGRESHRRGEPVKLGFLLGTRRFETNVHQFCCGDTLTVQAKRVVHGSGGMAAFECEVTGEGVQQSATLSVFEPADPTEILQGAG